MEQARTTISKIFNGEPRSYTRFNLTQNMEGDNSQVEMKLSSDTDDEVGGNGVGEHLQQNGGHHPYVVRQAGRSPRNICFMVASTVLIFIIGYLIGYLVHRDMPPICPTAPPIYDLNEYEPGVSPVMDWSDVKMVLAQKLSTSSFENAFSEFARERHQAGSPGDEDLGFIVMKRFKEYNMYPWFDEHFVKVHDPPTSGTNRVSFKGKEEHLPSGYLSYSAIGSRTGAILYAHYGEERDFGYLRSRNINMTGRVILIKAGKISYAEKVANAAKMAASAVLIYGDSVEVGDDTQLYGHVHLGSGDPYTPGYPSFNHTLFAPVPSSGLPSILAQTITTRMATTIKSNLGGEAAPSEWKEFNRLGDVSDVVTVEVNNVLADKKITNVFGVIKGRVDPDRYVVLGAKRDAWGPGFAGSTVGTSVLMELARSFTNMVDRDQFKPRRSILFASWSAGEYGNIGATEWLEGYLSSLSMKAFAYIDLDAVVRGGDGFKASASPLLQGLVETTMKEIKSHINPSISLHKEFVKNDFSGSILEPLQIDNTAYPFLAFSGIPSVSFRFTGTSEYQVFGTVDDSQAKLKMATRNQISSLAVKAAQFAGHIALRLVHDRLLRFDLLKYDNLIRMQVAQINSDMKTINERDQSVLPKALTAQWLVSAAGSYNQATSKMATDIKKTDLDDIEMCRIYNDRLMMVEKNLLSPYVSPRDRPFRHILLGNGPHTIKALRDHLEYFRTNNPEANAERFRIQFALTTWTIQGCANALVGDVWSLDNEI